MKRERGRKDRKQSVNRRRRKNGKAESKNGGVLENKRARRRAALHSAGYQVNRILIIALLMLQFFHLCGQIRTDEEPKRLYFHMTQRVKRFRDMKDMRDVFHLDKYLMGKRRISGNISYNTGRVVIDDGIKKTPEIRHAIGYFTRIRFFEEFSFNTIFFTNFNHRANARWIADFNYAIGRYNWRAKRWNFGYENYTNNKYTDDWKTIGEKFLEGYYFLSYNYVPKKLNDFVKLDSTSSLRFIYFARYSLKYRDEFDVLHGGWLSGKAAAGIAFRYTIFRNVYFEFAVYLYDNHKQPWDPDFTYGFGYFDWRAFRLSLTYGNWAVNRFPWNKKYYSNYGFVDGNFRIVANWAW